MSAHHGNTPAAWTAVAVALIGFVVGGVGLMVSPISYPIFWIGVGLNVVAGLLFVVMTKMGLGEPDA